MFHTIVMWTMLIFFFWLFGVPAYMLVLNPFFPILALGDAVLAFTLSATLYKEISSRLALKSLNND